eukprot:TRINITY_DN10083_c0_g1_i1.p1 TRINITY_DN10083_c0_g1~~TRINITY_DN10083_c0_g1_i1.p1  ORF type:complete len:333 (+),score=77.40 TRINITY_DN10083_c0_g1_i1:141-1139(+)
MRAAVLTGFGDETVLTLVNDHPRPVPREREVLIRVKACALSCTDLHARSGDMSMFIDPPCVPGYEISGVVEEVGALTEAFSVGDEVVALSPLDCRYGGCAEYSVQKVQDVVAKPSSVVHEDAAASLAAGVLAYTALHYQLKVIAGETILIVGGASDRAHIAVQLASTLGLRVITTARTAEEISYLEDANVKLARIVDLSTTDLLEAVLEETGGLGVDAILDPSGDPSDADTMVDSLAVLGRWAHSAPDLQLDPPDSRRLFLKSASVSFFWEQAWVMSSGQQGRLMHIISDLMSKVRQDEVRPKVQYAMPLEKIQQAHRVLTTNRVGKVVVKL